VFAADAQPGVAIMDAQLINVLELVVVFSAVCYAVLLGCVLAWWKPRMMVPQSSCCLQQDQLTVVIAARNEADNLGPCLQSLLHQSGIAQIIVVDDHSTDYTAAVVESFRALDARVVPLSAPELPAVWLGKSHALDFGAKQVSTPYLLFTDADVIFGPGIIAEALRKMSAARLYHLGGHFFVDCRSVAEEICAPVLMLSSGLALFGTANSLGAATGGVQFGSNRHVSGMRRPCSDQERDG
jgi:cellulose synthase/poly-beta-1,6-N-acetylglucosamine synthase-like glycosyltransferase